MSAPFAAARDLVKAGEHLLAEAESQELASIAEGAGGHAPSSAPPGAVQESIRATLAQELSSTRTLLAKLAPSEQTAHRARGAISLGNVLSNVNDLFEIVGLPTTVTKPLGAAALPHTGRRTVSFGIADADPLRP